MCDAVMDGNGAGFLVEVGVIVSAVVPAVVVVGIGVVGFWGTVLLPVMFMFLVTRSFGSPAWFGGLFSLSGVTGLLLLSWSHRGFSTASV